MQGAFIALLLTVNAAKLDTIETLRAFQNYKACIEYVNRERPKTKGKIACVPQRQFNEKRDEVFR